MSQLGKMIVELIKTEPDQWEEVRGYGEAYYKHRGSRIRVDLERDRVADTNNRTVDLGMLDAFRVHRAFRRLEKEKTRQKQRSILGCLVQYTFRESLKEK